MKYLSSRSFAGVVLLLIGFILLPVFASSPPSDALPISTECESIMSDSHSDSAPSTDTKDDSDNLDFLWNILGSGLVCAVFTHILDYFKEKKLRLLSAADALLAAFNAAFPDGFLMRDDRQWSTFRRRFSHFCENQTALIQRLKSNKHGAEIISTLTVDILIQKINQAPGTDLSAKEDAVRGYVGEQYYILTTRISR